MQQQIVIFKTITPALKAYKQKIGCSWEQKTKTSDNDDRMNIIIMKCKEQLQLKLIKSTDLKILNVTSFVIHVAYAYLW